jgi:ASC-1-like (ASCH) protein
MTYNEVTKVLEEILQRRIQLKIKLNQIKGQNDLIDSIVKKNRTLLGLAGDKIKQLKSSDLVDMENFLRLKASSEPVVAVIDANLFRKQQNDTQLLMTEKEIKELDAEKKRLEEMLNEASKIYRLFQETRKGGPND